MLTVLSKVEGLATLSQPVESLKVEQVKLQYRKFKIPNQSLILEKEQSNDLVIGSWNLGFLIS